MSAFRPITDTGRRVQISIWLPVMSTRPSRYWRGTPMTDATVKAGEKASNGPRLIDHGKCHNRP